MIPYEEALGTPSAATGGGVTPAGTLAALNEALAQGGLPPADVPAVVLAGAHAADVLPAVLARVPNARVLLVDADGPTLAAYAPGGAPMPAGRCFIASASVNNGPRIALVAELVEFFSAVPSPPSAALVLAPHGSVVQDFCSGFSAGLFAELAAGTEVPTPVLRAIADFLFDERDLYHALKYYFTVYAREAAPQAGWRILECLADLGSSEWVERWLDKSIFSPEFRAQITSELAGAPDASRRLRRECLDKNLAALARFPELAGAVAAAGPGKASLLYLPATPWRVRYDGRTLAISRDDYPLLVVESDDGTFLRELNPPPVPEDFRTLAGWLKSTDQPHAAVVGWVRNAWAAEMLLSTKVVSGLPGWQRLVFLLETDVGALAALLGVLDLSRQLRSGVVPDVGPFVGPDAEARFSAYLRNDADTPTPGVWIGDSAGLARSMAAVHAARVTTAEANKRALDATITQASLGDTLAALRGQRPLRVAIATTLYSDVVQHTADDLAAAFRHLGHTCVVLRERSAGQVIHYQTLTARLLELKPDLVILLNHTRAEAARFHPRHVPYVTWIQDELPSLKDPALIAALGPLDFSFGFSPSVQQLFRQLGHPRVGLLPFAASKEGLTADIPSDVRDEVVFPTHLSLPSDPTATPGLLPWLEQRFEDRGGIAVAMSEVGPEVDAALRALNLKVSERDRQEARFAGMMLARAMERIALADKLLDNEVPLALYGKGWDQLERFAAHHRGPVAPGAPLREVLRSHKVVLHVNRGCNVHPRLLEGFAAGGFVLGKHEDSDDAPGDTRDQFVLGQELLLFRDEDELLELIDRARTDEPWRRGIIESARARISRSHTYESRAATIIEDVATGMSSHLQERSRT